MFKYPFDTNYKKSLYMSFLNIQRLVTENFSRSCHLGIGAGMAIAGGITAAGAGAQAIATGKLNKKNRDWQEKMYARQLADERENWNMVNSYNEEMYHKYNSPSAQVAQYRAAGLNPDLQDISPGGLSPSGEIGASGVPSVSGQQPIDLIGAFANIAEMFQGLQSMQLDNDLKKAQLDKLSSSAAMDLLAKSYVPRTTGDDGVSFSVDIESPHKLERYFRGLGLSRRSSRVAAAMVRKSSVNDAKKSYYTKAYEAEKSRFDYINQISQPRYSDFDDVMNDSFSEFFDSLDKFDKIVRDAQSAKSKYDRDYFNSSSGSVDSASDALGKSLDNEGKQLNIDTTNAKNAKSLELDSLLKEIKSPFVRLVLRSLYSRIVGD